MDWEPSPVTKSRKRQRDDDNGDTSQRPKLARLTNQSLAGLNEGTRNMAPSDPNFTSDYSATKATLRRTYGFVDLPAQARENGIHDPSTSNTPNSGLQMDFSTHHAARSEDVAMEDVAMEDVTMKTHQRLVSSTNIPNSHEEHKRFYKNLIIAQAYPIEEFYEPRDQPKNYLAGDKLLTTR